MNSSNAFAGSLRNFFGFILFMKLYQYLLRLLFVDITLLYVVYNQRLFVCYLLILQTYYM